MGFRSGQDSKESVEVLTQQVSGEQARWWWFSSTWLLPPSIAINNPKHRVTAVHDIIELWKENWLSAVGEGHIMWSGISFLSANVEFLTRTVSIAQQLHSHQCHSASRRWRDERKKNSDGIYQSSHAADLIDNQHLKSRASLSSSVKTELQQSHDYAVNWSYFLRENIFFKIEHKLSGKSSDSNADTHARAQSSKGTSVFTTEDILLLFFCSSGSRSQGLWWSTQVQRWEQEANEILFRWSGITKMSVRAIWAFSSEWRWRGFFFYFF